MRYFYRLHVMMWLLVLVSCNKEPSISVEESTYSWGKVIQGDDVSHSFSIGNDGNAPLQIDEIKTSCGCVLVSFDRRILPGHKGKIDLKLRTKGLRDRISKTVTVLSNDKSNGDQELTLVGEVVPFAKYEPSRVELSGFPGDIMKRTIELTPTTNMDISFMSAEPSDNAIQVATQQNENHLRLVLEAVAGDQPATTMTTLDLRIKTSDDVEREMSIRVLIKVLDPIVVFPKKALVFGSRW